jgi:hypothetical protein
MRTYVATAPRKFQLVTKRYRETQRLQRLQGANTSRLRVSYRRKHFTRVTYRTGSIHLFVSFFLL